MTKNNRTSQTIPASQDGLELTEIQIWPVRDPQASRIKAMASLTFNGMIRVNSCRLIEGAKGMFVSFPAEKRQGTDEWTSFVHPVTREASDRIQERVVERYRELVAAAA
jgi:stage V sporulation protein G